ncbi:hypothetical protein LXA43DRAFT_446389 [Ganoderma leucocontextum]|nr:hypothetical protein LXA43DRAFT_446389 [Ganoderma leucocontextum]
MVSWGIGSAGSLLLRRLLVRCVLIPTPKRAEGNPPLRCLELRTLRGPSPSCCGSRQDYPQSCPCLRRPLWPISKIVSANIHSGSQPL